MTNGLCHEQLCNMGMPEENISRGCNLLLCRIPLLSQLNFCAHARNSIYRSCYVYVSVHFKCCQSQFKLSQLPCTLPPSHFKNLQSTK